MDTLTPQEEAYIEAEEAIMDDMLGNLKMFCEEECREYLASLMELALYGKQDTKLSQIEAKCLSIHDYMARRKAGV